MIMAFVVSKADALEQRVSKQSSDGHSMPVSETLPSCLQQGVGRRCTKKLMFQLNSREKYLEGRRNVLSTYQKYNAVSIQARANGTRMANPLPSYSSEAALKAAEKLAKQFMKKPAQSTDICSDKVVTEAILAPTEKEKVALPANKNNVEERNLLLDSGASFNIIGRAELTRAEWATRKSIPPITLNTAAGQIVVDETVEVYVRELDATFVFLLLPECQPALSMGQLADDYDFSWKRVDGVKTMRIYDEAGTELVSCILQDFCPRMFNITQDTAADVVEESTSTTTSEAKDLVAQKLSFYTRTRFRGRLERSERQSAQAISVSSPDDAAADGNAHTSVKNDEMVKSDPAHAVEPVKDSGSDHSDAQADVAEKEDLLSQSSKTSGSKTPPNTVINVDGSEIALNERLSKKINSMQRKKNREEKTLAAKAAKAKPLPVKLAESEATKVGTVRKSRRRKKRITKEGGVPASVHNVFTHFPFDATCKVCLAAKIQKASHAACTDHRRCDALPEATAFADRLTADHKIMNEENKSAGDEDLVACIIQDIYTSWLQAYPCKTKSASETLKCFQTKLGPKIKALHVYTDN